MKTTHSIFGVCGLIICKLLVQNAADVLQIECCDIDIAGVVEHSAAYNILHFADYRLSVFVQHIDASHMKRCACGSKAVDDGLRQSTLSVGQFMQRNVTALLEIADNTRASGTHNACKDFTAQYIYAQIAACIADDFLLQSRLRQK